MTFEITEKNVRTIETILEIKAHVRSRSVYILTNNILLLNIGIC